ncbi:MAG TPA: hypothetical protein VN240_07015 [Propylenella sp.]|nr:hypothetical protein [Propylenella sp.]
MIAAARALEMTVSDARKILLHPRFGDERCIEAHKLLLLALDVREARWQIVFGGKYCNCSACLKEFNIARLKPIEVMTAEDLREELSWWFECEVDL